MPDEPIGNVSGGASGGGQETAFDPADPEIATRTEVVVGRLGEHYWRKAYGGRGGFECLVRAILSWSTSDEANQPAHDELMTQYDGGDLAEPLAVADHEDIAEAIHSSSLYNRKSKLIQGAVEEVLADFGSEADFGHYVRKEAPTTVRDRLLEMKGISPRIVGCVLLFAGRRGGVFSIDTHVHRITRRIGLAPTDADRGDTQAVLKRDIPGEKCSLGHTAVIQLGREFCKAREPTYFDGPEACPMADVRNIVGVDAAARSVADPAVASD